MSMLSSGMDPIVGVPGTVATLVCSGFDAEPAAAVALAGEAGGQGTAAPLLELPCETEKPPVLELGGGPGGCCCCGAVAAGVGPCCWPAFEPAIAAIADEDDPPGDAEFEYAPEGADDVDDEHELDAELVDVVGGEPILCPEPGFWPVALPAWFCIIGLILPLISGLLCWL